MIRRNRIMTKNNEKEVENQAFEGNMEKELSSLDFLWKLGFEELNVWEQRFNKYDAQFLEAAKNYVESIKQNQENANTIAAQFSVELKDWEKAVREEFLVTATPLQNFFPVSSYEEINQVVEDIQNKTAQLLITPVQALTTIQYQVLDKYLETVEKYISFRKIGREKYMESIKKTSNVLYENQKLFVNLFAKQVKSTMFPLEKYMINSSELTKS
jgi:hypothetical protein